MVKKCMYLFITYGKIGVLIWQIDKRYLGKNTYFYYYSTPLFIVQKKRGIIVKSIVFYR